MAKGKVASAATAAGAVHAARTTQPYVQKLIEDAELRANLLTAFESAKDAFDKLSDGKNPAAKVFEDKKLQNDLQRAAMALRDASVAIKDAPASSKRRKRGGLGRKLLLLAVGGGVALVASEGLRKKVLDLLFGAEEEFEYTSPTTAPPAPAPAAS